MTDSQFQPTPGAPAGFPFAENHVRARLGVNKDEMRTLRCDRLAPEDFTRHKKRVFLSGSATAKLLLALGGAFPQKNAAATPSANADDPNPSPRALTVCQTGLANPRLILACPEGENPLRPKTLLRVRIRPGTVLRRLQAILGRRIPPYTDFYELVSAPRRPPAALNAA